MIGVWLVAILDLHSGILQRLLGRLHPRSKRPASCSCDSGAVRITEDAVERNAESGSRSQRENVKRQDAMRQRCRRIARPSREVGW